MLKPSTQERVLALARQDVATAKSAIKMAGLVANTDVELSRYRVWLVKAELIVSELEKEWEQC